jgi:hypothetical protein
MKQVSTVFLQLVTVLIGIAVLTFLLWEPLREGRNIGSTVYQVYFNDPFLAWAYLGSIPFFVALFQVGKLLRYIAQDTVYTLRSVRALRTIKYCALMSIGFLVFGVAYLLLFNRGQDDIAGGVAMCVMIGFIFATVATIASVFEALVQRGVDRKYENELV